MADKQYVYKANYERVYFAITAKFYSDLAGSYFKEHGILQYMKWVESKIQEELVRADRFLEKSSIPLVCTFCFF